MHFTASIIAYPTAGHLPATPGLSARGVNHAGMRMLEPELRFLVSGFGRPVQKVSADTVPS